MEKEIERLLEESIKNKIIEKEDQELYRFGVRQLISFFKYNKHRSGFYSLACRTRGSNHFFFSVLFSSILCGWSSC